MRFYFCWDKDIEKHEKRRNIYSIFQKTKAAVIQEGLQVIHIYTTLE